MENKRDNLFGLLLMAEDPRSQATVEIARRAARSNATVLISGETGVGKELIARYIHDCSSFSNGPYVSVNCSALPEHMIEAILFGYEKGAFTGASSSYVGKFEQAQHGTLLLDEVAELPLSLQAKLLRVLQERQVERLGGKKMIDIDCRIVAATNRNLHDDVESGSFRSDLYYRLNVIPLFCEALRHRPLDILPLAEFFINKYSAILGIAVPTLSENAKQKLSDYPWPGNVRELENTIHRTLIMMDGNRIEDKDILLTEMGMEKEKFEDLTPHFDSSLKATEAQIILHTLKENAGHRNNTAKFLNMSERTLRYKISKLKSIGVKIP